MRLSTLKGVTILKHYIKSNSPAHAQWFLTRRCNYRCKGCEVWLEKDYSGELSTEEIKIGLDNLRKLGVLEIVFSGGNPLLREDIGEILEYSSRYFITTIYDNGSIAAEKVDALKYADFVAISLDTLDEKKNDYLKGVAGSWRKAMNSIETLKNAGINVCVSPTISHFNVDEIIDFTKYFTERKIPVWYCLYWYDYAFEGRLFGIGTKNDEYEIVEKERLVRVIDEIRELKKERKGIFITDKTLEAVRELYANDRRTWNCKALQNFLVIDHLGRVAGCHCREPVTTIFELPEVWKSPELDRKREEYSKCTKCAYLCYIFYSVHTNTMGEMSILRDQWANIKFLLEKENTAEKLTGIKTSH